MVHCKVTLNVLQIDNQLLTSDIVLCLCDHLQQTKTVMYLCTSILYTFCRFYFVIQYIYFVIYKVIDMHIASSYHLYFLSCMHISTITSAHCWCVLCKLSSVQRNVSKTTSIRLFMQHYTYRVQKNQFIAQRTLSWCTSTIFIHA